jgi:hypothetical protein
MQEVGFQEILVINASHSMAKEITRELAERFPACSFIYAPSLAIARLVLRARPINLIVSSAILPDGGVEQIRPLLDECASPPELLVVGELSLKSIQLIGTGPYSFAEYRKFGPQPQAAPVLDEKLRCLGADIRNDLNNPLQEIVALLFVAQSGGENVSSTQEALGAIASAAKNMAQYVNSLEEKIREVVS